MVRTRYGTPHSLWRAVGQDGDTLDILRQPRHDRTAATRCFRELLKGLCAGPCVIIIDTLKRESRPRATSCLVANTGSNRDSPTKMNYCTNRLDKRNGRCEAAIR